MSGYREAPPEEPREEMPDFRPRWRLDRIPFFVWTIWLALPTFECRRTLRPTSWDELWVDVTFWLRLGPVALVAFIAWSLMRRLPARAEDESARLRFEQAEPRFDPPRNDIL